MILGGPSVRLRRPLSSMPRMRSRFTLESLRSTLIGLIWRIVASGVVWFAVTSAPAVTEEVPISPSIGAVTLVWVRLICACSTLALAAATSALACASAALASSRFCPVTELAPTSWLYRSTLACALGTAASAFSSAAAAAS